MAKASRNIGSQAAASRPDDVSIEQLRTENGELRAELERMRARYERPVAYSGKKEKPPAEQELERFALVGRGEQPPERRGPSNEALDSVGEMLCRMLRERQPGTRWNYYRDENRLPEGMTFFYAHEVLRKMWGDSPGNPGPPTPQAYRRLTTAEREERDGRFQAALHRIDETLEWSETLHQQGHAVAAAGLLKYVDLLLARFNLAFAQQQAGKSGWQDVLDDSERDAEFEAWVTAQTSSTSGA